MKLDQLPGNVNLTYCTNIHAGESWPDIRASLDAHVPAIKAAVTPDRPLGIGLRLSGQAAAVARQPEALAAFRAQLASLGAYVFTINAFPFGPFHGVRVKEQVYLPDWRSPERVAFTADAAAALADLVLTERRTGKRIALALEPEPSCFLETTDESLAFFETELLKPRSLDALAAKIGESRGGAESMLRRHLGICYDVCHGSVEYEDPVAALDRLLAAGISVPKVQLSAAMRIPAMTHDLIKAVMRYDDGVYLHQTIVRGPSGLTRYVDLPDAVAAFEDGRARGEWRIHCHVPLFLSDLGEIGSTRADLVSTLSALRQKSRSSHLEVETYTWDVLPDHLRTGSKAADIAREISFCKTELVG